MISRPRNGNVKSCLFFLLIMFIFVWRIFICVLYTDVIVVALSKICIFVKTFLSIYSQASLQYCIGLSFAQWTDDVSIDQQPWTWPLCTLAWCMKYISLEDFCAVISLEDFCSVISLEDFCSVISCSGLSPICALLFVVLCFCLLFYCWSSARMTPEKRFQLGGHQGGGNTNGDVTSMKLSLCDVTKTKLKTEWCHGIWGLHKIKIEP